MSEPPTQCFHPISTVSLLAHFTALANSSQFYRALYGLRHTTWSTSDRGGRCCEILVPSSLTSLFRSPNRQSNLYGPKYSFNSFMLRPRWQMGVHIPALFLRAESGRCDNECCFVRRQHVLVMDNPASRGVPPLLAGLSTGRHRFHRLLGRGVA